MECEDYTDDIKGLPDIAGLATTDDEKLALVRAWIRCWRGPGFWLSRMPGALWLAPRSEGGSATTLRIFQRSETFHYKPKGTPSV